MQEVDEGIQVAMLFRGHEVRPSAFLWNGHRYEVTRILLAHKTRLGENLRWYFTVLLENDATARLVFDTSSLHWSLEAIEVA